MIDYTASLLGVVILVLMALYTVFSLIFLFIRDRKKDGRPNDKRKEALAFMQGAFLLLMHFACFAIMFLKNGNVEIVFLYGAQLIYLLATMILYRNFYPGASREIVHHMCMLIMIGLVMNTRLDFNKSIRHFVFVVIATIVSMIVPILIEKIKIITKLGWLWAVIGIGTLSFVALKAQTTYGAKLGFSFGQFNIQPSEFVKLTFAFAVAGILYKSHSFWRVALATIVAAAHVLILVYSTDLGSALIFFVAYLIMIAVATGRFIYPFLGVLAGAGAAYYAYQLFPHVQQRVHVWMNPFADYQGSGYQIGQSMFSIAAGGWRGLGLMNGTPNSIPIVEMDSMLAAIAEELGSVFTILLLLVFLCCFFMFIRVANRLKNRFYSIAGMGLATMFGIQVFLTAGGTMKLIPMTGVTLPLISYGGSSMLSTIIMFGIFMGNRASDSYSREQYGAPGEELQNTKKNESNEDVGLYGAPEYERKERRRKLLGEGVGRKARLATAVIFSLMFCSLIGYLMYFNTKLADDLNQNEYNTKFLIAQNHVIRGNIYSADGEILAQTNIDETGNEKRVYPWGYVFSHVTGYAENGKTGIEDLYDQKMLAASSNTDETPESDSTENSSSSLEKTWDDFVVEVQDHAQRKELEAQPKTEQGDSLFLTMDTRLQYAAYNALGGFKGAIVAMEPKTGKILAMVSKPDFDPNEIGFMWETLNANEANSPLLNRATQGLYTPGSVFKIVTALEYLEEHPENYTDYAYNCDGTLTREDIQIHCFDYAAHGYVNLQQSFQQSCNTSFANIGEGLDLKRFGTLAEKLMFNMELPFEYPSAVSRFYLTEESDVRDVLTTAIGQGQTLVSPFHMALIVSAIANDGKMMHPYLLDHVENADGEIVEKTAPTVDRELISTQQASIMKEMMRSVVDGGTAKKLMDCSYTVAGKTGSAEYLKSDGSEYSTHSWFAGYSNIEDPELVVVVIAEDGGTGNTTAVPVAREVFDAYYDMMAMQTLGEEVQ